MWAGGWIVLFGFATTANRERICLANKFQRHTDRKLYRRLERDTTTTATSDVDFWPIYKKNCTRQTTNYVSVTVSVWAAGMYIYIWIPHALYGVFLCSLLLYFVLKLSDLSVAKFNSFGSHFYHNDLWLIVAHFDLVFFSSFFLYNF